MATIPISLDDETVKKLDILVKRGIYKNRSEALRTQIKNGLKKFEFISFFDTHERSPTYESALKYLLSLKTPPNILKTEKTITELVSEGRER